MLQISKILQHLIFHSGKIGENGPVITTLLKEDNPTTAITSTAMTEVLLEGNITSINLEDPMVGKLLSHITSTRSEQTLLIPIEIYINKHYIVTLGNGIITIEVITLGRGQYRMLKMCYQLIVNIAKLSNVS